MRKHEMFVGAQIAQITRKMTDKLPVTIVGQWLLHHNMLEVLVRTCWLIKWQLGL